MKAWQSWHNFPFSTGFFLILLLFVSDPEWNGIMELIVAMLWLPFAVVALSSALQVIDMDRRLLETLSPYNLDGIAVDGVLADAAPKGSKSSRFLVTYQMGDVHITKTIIVNNEEEQTVLRNKRSIPLIALPCLDASAIAQSWLKEQEETLRSTGRQLIHLAVSVYGAACYLLFPLVLFGNSSDAYAFLLLIGCFLMALPIVHSYMLESHTTLYDNLILCSQDPTREG